MNVLIQDLLDYSRVENVTENKDVIDMNQVYSQVLRNLDWTIKDNQAIIECGELPMIKGVFSQMVQIFQNLIGNGIKFKASDRPPHICVQVNAEDAGTHWVFSVQDNGIGIEKDYIDSIFLPFKRLHTKEEYKGSGIGLAICKKIVERHGGKLWVQSDIGVGSIFFFSLPKYIEESE